MTRTVERLIGDANSYALPVADIASFTLDNKIDGVPITNAEDMHQFVDVGDGSYVIFIRAGGSPASTDEVAGQISALANVPSAEENAAATWANSERTLTAFDFTVDTNVANSLIALSTERNVGSSDPLVLFWETADLTTLELEQWDGDSWETFAGNELTVDPSSDGYRYVSEDLSALFTDTGILRFRVVGDGSETQDIFVTVSNVPSATENGTAAAEAIERADGMLKKVPKIGDQVRRVNQFNKHVDETLAEVPE